MKVPFLDLTRQYASIRTEVEEALLELCRSQKFILGETVENFEKEIVAYCGTKRAVAVASGSDALLLSLMAAGIGTGDEVITSPFTFFATAGSIHRTGARPVFVDIDPDTFNIDPALIERAVTPRTRAIVPVHLFGLCADMKRISEIARSRKLLVIEDACQAIGSEISGKKAGSLGDIGCFSFFPSKNLGGFGDGGCITTDSDEIADKIKVLRAHGEVERYHHRWVGINSRMDALQAAVLAVKLKHLDAWNAARSENAAFYNDRFSGCGIDVPLAPQGFKHTYHQYALRLPGREKLVEKLRRAGIGCGVYYPVPLHLQECFAGLGYGRGNLPEAEHAADEVVSLPIFPELTNQELSIVADAVLGHLEGVKRLSSAPVSQE